MSSGKEVSSAIPDELIRSRVEHVVSGHTRVLEAKEQLEQGDLAAFGKLMNAPHESLRDLYFVRSNRL